MTDEIIPDVALVDNTSQRLPCVLVLDGSSSMADSGSKTDAIRELNAGLKVLASELQGDDIASQRVQVLVIRLGDDDRVETVLDWTDAMDFSAPTIVANGRTPLGAAMRFALQKVEDRKAEYRDHGISYNRPWVFAITDGYPTDLDWEAAAAECRAAEDNGKVTIFPIGTEGADFDALKQFSNQQPVRLEGLQFTELFVWLSRSASSASREGPGEVVQLESPTDSGWGTIVT
ncbi:MAG TPA: VWA domain-containing protein [Myxococcales bacterium]|nr:VWA domain-containing protein [Myxococcales bacterium]